MPTSLQSRARVVIGDDNDTTLQTISRIVRVQFDVVDTVRDGETAINSIELLKPDVLVLDVFLPALDGIQVVRRLKTLGSPPQVVILTGLEGQAFVDAAMIAGQALLSSNEEWLSISYWQFEKYWQDVLSCPQTTPRTSSSVLNDQQGSPAFRETLFIYITFGTDPDTTRRCQSFLLQCHGRWPELGT